MTLIRCIILITGICVIAHESCASDSESKLPSVYRIRTNIKILEPLTQQVSQLMIPYEEEGRAMPDLALPVEEIKTASDNLVKVAYSTAEASKDKILRAEAPLASTRVTEESKLLQEASTMFLKDPFSAPARKKLIEGSRGVLQGTASLLIAIDESNVRKIIAGCKGVFEYLQVAEIIDQTADLKIFLDNLTPGILRITKDTDSQENDLTNIFQRDILVRASEQVQTMVPYLINSIKVYILTKQVGVGASEAQKNRDYILNEISDDIIKIIRVMKIATYKEDVWDTNQGQSSGDLPFANRPSTEQIIKDLEQNIQRELSITEKTDIRPAYTLCGKINQVQIWLENSEIKDGGLGEKAARMIVADGQNVAKTLSDDKKGDLMHNCYLVESLINKYAEVCKNGRCGFTDARKLATELVDKLNVLKCQIQNAVVGQVVDDFIDINTPLKQLIKAAMKPKGVSNREEIFHDKAMQFQSNSQSLSDTAKMVARAGGCNNRETVEAINSLSQQVKYHAAQVINAAKIALLIPGNRIILDNVNSLETFLTEDIERLRVLVDVAIDSKTFIKASEASIRHDTDRTEDGISKENRRAILQYASNIARRANRVVEVAQLDAENSDDPKFVERCTENFNQLSAAVESLVQYTENVVINPSDQQAIKHWRQSNQALIAAVGQVYDACLPMPPELNIDGQPPKTDNKDEATFSVPQANQPIMMAAHALYLESKEWLTQENDMVLSAKKMALLMARISHTIGGEGGSRKELINTAKQIGKTAREFTRLGRALADACTNKRVKTNLLKVYDRIPTIETQFTIASNVKATMLGAEGTEDQVATEILVRFAQNLMQSVQETFNAAESALIYINSSYKIRMVRKRPWDIKCTL